MMAFTNKESCWPLTSFLMFYFSLVNLLISNSVMFSSSQHEDKVLARERWEMDKQEIVGGFITCLWKPHQLYRQGQSASPVINQPLILKFTGVMPCSAWSNLYFKSSSYINFTFKPFALRSCDHFYGALVRHSYNALSLCHTIVLRYPEPNPNSF